MDNIYKISIISSAMSAICTKTSVAPLERLKLLKQSQIFYKANTYNSLYDSFKYIYVNEGFKGYYRGNLTNLVRVIPAYTLKFPLNEFFKNKFISNKDKPKFKNLLLSGTCAGLLQTSITYPLDILRTRMTIDKNMTKNYTNIFRCLTNIIKNEGTLALYKGFNINLSTYPLYVGIQFSIYEYLRGENPIIAGTIAGTIAQSLMYPGDVLKRQLQLNGIDNSNKKISSISNAVKYIYNVRGIGGFYQGYFINLIKVVPEATLQFFVYDYIKNNYNKIFSF
jgi:hypothetical protein